MTILDPSADYFILIYGARRGTGVMRAAERSSSASTRRVAPSAILPTTSRNVPFRAVAMPDDCFDGVTKGRLSVAKGRYLSRRSHRPTGVPQVPRKTGAITRQYERRLCGVQSRDLYFSFASASAAWHRAAIGQMRTRSIAGFA